MSRPGRSDRLRRPDRLRPLGRLRRPGWLVVAPAGGLRRLDRPGWLVGVPAGGLLALAALAGCTAAPGAGPPRLASLTATAGPATPAPARPTGPAAPPYRRAAPPPGPAGQLATLAAPAARRRLWLQVWFSGLRIDGAGRGLVVVYPSVAASSDGQRLVLHAKVATFRCAARVADGSPNYAGCQRRSVEYGDLTGPAVQVRRPAGHLVLAGRFPTYTYRRGVDRDRRVRPRWTGRTYQIRLDVRPDQPAPGPPGTATVAGVVTLGSGRTAVSAAVDAGYPNRIQLADPAPAPPAAGPPTGRVVPP